MKIVTVEEGMSFHKLNPFTVARELRKMGPFETRRTAAGDLLVKTNKKQQTEALLSIKSLGGAEVKVLLPQRLNFSEGVIHAPELAAMEPEEIAAEMSAQGVLAVRRLKGALLYLKLNSKELPQYIRAKYLRYKVRPFNRGPARCMKCTETGHMETSCLNNARCGKCAGSHRTAECTNSVLFCPSCGGNHPLWALICPANRPKKPVAMTSRAPQEVQRQQLEKTPGPSQKRRKPVKPSPDPAPATKKPPMEHQPKLPMNPLTESETYQRMNAERRKELSSSSQEENDTDSDSERQGGATVPITVYSARTGVHLPRSYSDIARRNNSLRYN